MAELDKTSRLLWKNSLCPHWLVDAVTKLLIEKGMGTDAELKQKLLEERATYQRILNPTVQWSQAHLTDFRPSSMTRSESRPTDNTPETIATMR